ncbi:Lon protease-like protein [Cryobacterium sp. MP_M5]|nr:Lon protease-like protein [Cryobacterium sp. MP_M5]
MEWFAGGMTNLPMFPLGSVLFPYLPLQLRVFEERYLVMLSRILADEPAEFGVVLIERGQEVGGGEHRFRYGTVAQVTQLAASDGFVGVLAQGERRVEVLEWLDEDPYPEALIRDIPELDWDDDLYPLREEAEQAVRRALALASEFTDQAWSPDVELSEDPTAAAWQLAGITPVGPLDQIALLRSTTMEGLLTAVLVYTAAAVDSFRFPWPEE